LTNYILTKIEGTSESFYSTLQNLVTSPTPSRLGFVFSERLINMPVQIVPPMYRMLSDELAKQNGPKYTHLLFVSRIYRLTQEEQDALLATAPTPKKKKAKNAAFAKTPTPNTGAGTFSFHPEDEYVQKVRCFHLRKLCT
jgi:protein BCP1